MPMNRIYTLLVALILFASCATQKDIPYFQDAIMNSEFEYTKGSDITIKTDDMLSIVVSSKNPELAIMFNLPRVQQNAVDGTTTTTNSSSQLMGYTVDKSGNIDFPVIGKIHIAGQTKEEVAVTIKNILVQERLINDPIVTVGFMNLQYYVLGEVARPGKYLIDKNQTTILEAISTAGDLTIFGKRNRVFLTRNVGDKKVSYQLDMRSQDIYTSPAFYVEQNDLIYIEPSNTRANQATVNGNTVRSTSFWMSMASFLTTLIVLIVN